MSLLRKILRGAACIGLLYAVGAQASYAAIIQLRAQSTASSAVIRLGDLADVYDEDPATVERLKSVTLQPAPTTGGRAFVRLDEIKSRLEGLGENMVAVEFRGAASTIVEPRRSETKVEQPTRSFSRGQYNQAEQRVATTIDEYLQQRAPGMAVASVAMPEDKETLRRILTSNISYWQVSGGKSPWIGRQSFAINTDDEAAGGITFHVTAELAAMQRMLVLQKPIAAGQVISRKDLAWKPVTQLPPTKAILNDPNAVVGREAVRQLTVGNAIQRKDVRNSLLIKRGDTVDVYSRVGAVQIHTVARAEEDGAFGDQIRLKTLENDDKIVGRVVGFHVAEITPDIVRPETGRDRLNIRYTQEYDKLDTYDRRNLSVRRPPTFQRR